MNMYEAFETDGTLETAGVWFDYGSFRVLCAHASNGNKKYLKLAEAKLKPLRRAIDTGAIDNERSMEVMAEIFAKTVILGWEVMVDGKWKKGMHNRAGEIISFTEAHVIQAFKDLPSLFSDIQQAALDVSNYRKAEVEADSKNS